MQEPSNPDYLAGLPKQHLAQVTFLIRRLFGRPLFDTRDSCSDLVPAT